MTPGDERVFQLIETMLHHRHRRQDQTELMQTLRSRFPNARALLFAEPFLLERCGVHPHDALWIHQLIPLTRIFDQQGFKKHPYLARLNLASDYLMAQFRNRNVERFYMVCLNKLGKLKELVFLQEGTADGTLFDLSTLLKHVMRVQPRAVILSHNHPGGTLRPSQADLDCTHAALLALATIGVPLLDHIIVTDTQAVSLRENAFIPTAYWMNQDPTDNYLKRWLDQDKDLAINWVEPR